MILQIGVSNNPRYHILFFTRDETTRKQSIADMATLILYIYQYSKEEYKYITSQYKPKEY